MKHFRGVMGNFGDGSGQCGGAVGQWGPRAPCGSSGCCGVGMGGSTVGQTWRSGAQWGSGRGVRGRGELGGKRGSIIGGTSGCWGPGEGHSWARMVSVPHVLGVWGGTGADPNSPCPGLALRCPLRRGTGVPGGPESPQQLRVGVWSSRDLVFPCHLGVGTVRSGNAVFRPEWLEVTPPQWVTGFTGWLEAGLGTPSLRGRRWDTLGRPGGWGEGEDGVCSHRLPDGVPAVTVSPPGCAGTRCPQDCSSPDLHILG